MEKYITPQPMVRPAEDIERITLALDVSNNASLITNPANADPDPAYRLDKASLAIQQTQQLAEDLEADPLRFNLDRITAALTIILLKKATVELRSAIDEWIEYLDSMPNP